MVAPKWTSKVTGSPSGSIPPDQLRIAVTATSVAPAAIAPTIAAETTETSTSSTWLWLGAAGIFAGLFLIGVRDMNFVQAYRRTVLAALPVRSRSPAFVTPELIIRARRDG